MRVERVGMKDRSKPGVEQSSQGRWEWRLLRWPWCPSLVGRRMMAVSERRWSGSVGETVVASLPIERFVPVQCESAAQGRPAEKREPSPGRGRGVDSWEPAGVCVGVSLAWWRAMPVALEEGGFSWLYEWILGRYLDPSANWQHAMRTKTTTG